jgi:hypothetical protein
MVDDGSLVYMGVSTPDLNCVNSIYQ